MTNDIDGCDEERLSRYIDGETTPQERQRIDRHLADCIACRQYLQQQQQLAGQLHREVTAARQAVDFGRLAVQITDSVGKRPPLRDTLLSWKLLLPVAATAALVLFFFTSVFQPPAPAGPSAIINSFTGKVSSVMILETPQSRNTVIWYSEETREGNGTESKKL